MEWTLMSLVCNFVGTCMTTRILHPFWMCSCPDTTGDVAKSWQARQTSCRGKFSC
ncbi:hypothetical protein PF010_g28303 [Phytophthora fragariae]|uniref:Uncharacterized protein n=1 Tax=Phytophthora fragariae TaxID=53985 RepID=A0A6A3WVM7_9STRA|nr:hypothetical protein PF003_g35095 [Phytophthora fragariae]KAE8931812.1 hypothetical protein PF009_g18138 [Phytophthora fragariae]KAE9065195.1 hypothetical protein PF010_g28303 [Phytophthora fragariae]KAE9075484.1 hypothetical protein PF006_g28325 [Phytophthora fragariae]KAE9161681.1 hypothetical protein PF004_g30744 [Phytophthora fragariae]